MGHHPSFLRILRARKADISWSCFLSGVMRSMKRVLVSWGNAGLYEVRDVGTGREKQNKEKIPSPRFDWWPISQFPGHYFWKLLSNQQHTTESAEVVSMYSQQTDAM